MPVVLRLGPWRFFFYSDEGGEPPHIHVAEGDKAAKFWLRNAELARSRGFRGYEIAALRKIVAEYAGTFEEAWNVHFDNPE